MSNSTAPQISHGKHIAFSDTDGGTYTPLAKTTEIGWPEREIGKADVTNDDSPSFTKQYLPSLKEPGTVSVKYVWTPDAYAAIETIFALADVVATRASATKFFKITLADGSTSKFSGFFTKNDCTPGDGEDVVVGEAEIQVTSPMTFTAAQASA